MTFNIGEAIFEKREDTGKLLVRVKKYDNPFAPTFYGDEMTGNSNSRFPGSRAWSMFCEAVGLTDLFFNQEYGLMSSHPGCFSIENDHYNIIHNALVKYKENNPNTNPGFCDCYWQSVTRGIKRKGIKCVCGYTKESSYLAILIWLDFWFKWALDNCKIPAIYNS